MSTKNCLLLGGGGFIGSHLADELLNKGYKVTIFDKFNFSKNNIQHIINNLNIIEGDFNNKIDLKKSLKNINYIFHLVSSTLPATSNQNPVYDVESNVVSTLNLFQECIFRKIKKVVFISSGGTVYGIPEIVPIPETHPRKPICSYGITKKIIEDYLYLYNKMYELDYVVFRLSNPYGERQSPMLSQGVIPIFLRKIHYNKEIEIWGDGNIIRDFIYIKDAVKVVANSIDTNTTEKIFNVGSGIGQSLNSVLEIMNKVTGKLPKTAFKKSREIDVEKNILDISLVKKTFKWQPETSIENGIGYTYDYIKQNY
ncbi:MAG: NAD-dependent epimerase/dehydratase family protein [Ignavibacteria bacterium]|nr:NAD-dependent epimerase/dehydratase family protein [Ignavibacteria bacterium]